MNTDFKKPFLNDFKKVRDKVLRQKVEQVILEVMAAQTLQDIFGLKKLKGGKRGIYYRIKIADYRLGVSIEGSTVTFLAFMHRKDIYKLFP